MRAFFLIIIGLALISQEGISQKKVENGSFNTLLNIILKHDVKEITIPEAGKKKDVLFIDTREKKEYDVSHIMHAVYVGYEDFNLSSLAYIPKEREIIVYCSIGKRSEEISQKLVKAGYNNISNLYGGIFEWVNQGNKVVDLNNAVTNRVHAYGKFWGRWLNKGVRVYN